jgi:hypothetical protein
MSAVYGFLISSVLFSAATDDSFGLTRRKIGHCTAFEPVAP